MVKNKSDKTTSKIPEAHLKKMSMLGHLAFGIVHDIRNSLQILRASSMMIRKHSSDEHLSQYIDAIDMVVENTTQMSERVLSFSNKPTEKLAEMDLRLSIDECLALCEYMLPPHIRIEYQKPDVCMPIMGNEVEILQALLNLMKNAAEAVEESSRDGVISISMRECFPWIELVISDNGCGIKVDELDRIFDPLFTTKTDGTGIGLANVSIAIESHGGVISVESNDEEGSRFTIMLPKRSTTS